MILNWQKLASLAEIYVNDALELPIGPIVPQQGSQFYQGSGISSGKELQVLGRILTIQHALCSNHYGLKFPINRGNRKSDFSGYYNYWWRNANTFQKLKAMKWANHWWKKKKWI